MSKFRDALFADQTPACADTASVRVEPAVGQGHHQAELPENNGQGSSTASAGNPSADGSSSAVPPREKPLSFTDSFVVYKTADQTPRSYQAFKQRIHTKLVENIDISALGRIEGGRALEGAIERTIQVLLEEENFPLTQSEQSRLVRDVLNETLGLGPLEPLLSDSQINDILVNRYDDVWVDRNGKLELTAVQFKDEDHLVHVINRIVARVGRRVDESSPIVDARLPDGSRVNAIIPPLALDGPILSIRRFRTVPYQFDELLKLGSLTPAMAEFLSLAVHARLNILISGGTSAGKTTLLNILSGYIPERERIVTIEDTAELRLQQRHVLRLESRPANIEGQGAISQRELVKNALRMRPDRIVVGEVRGPEALDMLQAMNTGHEGSLTTLHANSPRDALSRLETLVLLSGVELTQRSIREQIGSAFDLIVQIKRLSDGTRRVVSVTEVTGIQEGVISLQELFTFRTDSIDERGRVIGAHTSCNLRPQCQQKFHESGIQLRTELFVSQKQPAEPASASSTSASATASERERVAIQSSQ